MKIGIIVHSHTGNTYSVAQRIKAELEKAGNQVIIERVTVVDEEQSEVSKVRLTNKPEAGDYDLLVLGAPVRGFGLSPAMTAYLMQLQAMPGSKALCFLTQFFPHPSMGGSRALKQMEELCISKGIQVCDKSIVNWSNLNREKRIKAVAEGFSQVR